MAIVIADGNRYFDNGETFFIDGIVMDIMADSGEI